MWSNGSSLTGLDEWIDDWSTMLCTACTTTAKDRHNEGRSLLWNSLPLHFDLGEWNELRGLELDMVSSLVTVN